MNTIQAFTSSLRDADEKHDIFVKREQERFESEKAQIYSRFQKMVDYDKCIDEFVRWWILMDEHCSQMNSYGHDVYLPSKIPSEVITKLKSVKLKHPRILFDYTEKPKWFNTPHHWTVSEDKYHLLKISPELELFCMVYEMCLKVGEKPHRVVWGN